MRNEFLYQTPVWYIFLCLGAGLLFALLFYFRTKTFSKNQRIFLAAIRGILTSLIAFLLLNPLIKSVSSIIIKPKVVVLVDDSRSMTVGKQIQEADNGIQALAKDIQNKGYQVDINTFNGDFIEGEINNDIFTGNKTNLSEALKLVLNNNEGQNLTDVIVFSDGIINDGIRPTFRKYPFNIHTIGYGDTTQLKDGIIMGISANRLAYLGNDFMVGVDVASYKLAGNTVELSIRNDQNEVLAREKVSYNSEDFFETVLFKIPASEVGRQRFVAQLQILEGESNTRNNRKDFVVDVVDGREKILLLAYAPHPDIKAIRSIVEKNDLFDLTVKIIQDNNDVRSIANLDFDVLILHQFPDSENVHTQFLGRLLSLQKPVFFILGSKSGLSYFNGMQNIVSISSQLNQTDRVTVKTNPSFNLFNISDNQANLFTELPPLRVPFGSYTVLPGTNVILDQYVSGLNVARPMLAVNLSGTRKMAAFLADGLWQWRLEEYAMTQNHEFIDDLITRTLQLISVKEDKSKLRVYPITETFEVDQPVVFIAEAYNEIFEPVYDQTITLKIRAAGEPVKTYEFKITESSSRFEITNLPAKSYSYEATATVMGKTEVSSGQFVVTDSDLEMQNTVADFNLLKTLANENNGGFAGVDNIIELRNHFSKENLVNKIISQEKLKDIINLRWLLFVIIGLGAIEWVMRKYLGSY